MLELVDVHRSYERGVLVLAGVDLALERGEVVGLLGENGSGKTTLVQIAMGMLHPQKGSVRAFGLDPAVHGVAVKRRIGYVSENQDFPPYLRARDVLDIHRSLYPTWDEAMAQGLLDRFRLTGREKISKLSKGQARRVAVLCAIAHRPELLLLDEPAGGFDPAARREFLETALQLLADEGSAVLFSSHHMGDVERLASRVCLLHAGRVLIDQDLDGLREAARLAVLPAGNGAAPADLRALDGCLAARVVGSELRGLFLGSEDTVRPRLTALRGEHTPALRRVSLEDFFVELVEGRR